MLYYYKKFNNIFKNINIFNVLNEHQMKHRKQKSALFIFFYIQKKKKNFYKNYRYKQF